jgi:hypothetical protein
VEIIRAPHHVVPHHVVPHHVVGADDVSQARLSPKMASCIWIFRNGRTHTRGSTPRVGSTTAIAGEPTR